MKLDRTKLSVVNSHAQAEADDIAYWQSRTPAERLRAMQINREIAYGEAATSGRLQRVLEVVERGRD